MASFFRRYALRGLALIAIIITAFFLAKQAETHETVRALVASYSYAGVFLLSLISGINIAVPIPAAAFIPLFVGAGLSLAPTVIVIALGTGIADMAAYLVGSIGRSAAKERSSTFTDRLERLRSSHRFLPLIFLFFFACFVPLPNELVVIPLVFMGYRFFEVLPVAILGNFVFTSLAAAGFLGVFTTLG
jgi:membrane protein YqaA with SNARE-associated domain